MVEREIDDQPELTSREPGSRESRRHLRHETFDLAEVVSLHCELVGSVVNISDSGLKLQIAQGALPTEGEPVTVCLAEGSHLSGRVVWIGGKDVGVEFDREQPTSMELLWPEVGGANWFGRLVHLQRKRHSQQ